MAKQNRHDRPSQETVAEAMRIARANQRPGQTKEQTRLIAQGIQKGIDQYKKQQKAKAREQDKRRKNAAQETKPEPSSETVSAETLPAGSQSKWPWILLTLSWLGFGLYLVFFR
jgi:hypothetical protein